MQNLFKSTYYFKLVIIFIVFIIAGCDSSKVYIEKSVEHYSRVNKSYKIDKAEYQPKNHHELKNYEEYGVASWYNAKRSRRAITATGDKFNHRALTAAHKTLPFMSVVKITVLSNNKSINVTINDRGPFCKSRIIDVSEKTAELLGFKNKGVARVKIEYLKEESENLLKKIAKNNKKK